MQRVLILVLNHYSNIKEAHRILLICYLLIALLLSNSISRVYFIFGKFIGTRNVKMQTQEETFASKSNRVIICFNKEFDIQFQAFF